MMTVQSHAFSRWAEAKIRKRLAVTPGAGMFGRHLVYRARVGSTNDLCRQLACEGAPEGLVVLADEQTAGRGRLARRWHAPPGAALLMSVLFRPELEPAQVARLVMLCSVSAAEAVEAVTGLHVGIKWPNDLLLGDEKCAGVLAELGLTGAWLEYVVVGLGLNVNFDPQGLPEVGTRATSLMRVLGHPVERLDLLVAILEGLAARYDDLRAGRSVLAEWRARLVTLGRPVVVSDPGGRYTGVAEAVDEDGTLYVRQDDGTLVPVRVGDVTLRPEGLA